MSYVAHLLGQVLQIIYNIVGNYGTAIILFTLLIKLLMVPLTLQQTKSTAGVQSLQPEIKALQEQYKNDKQKLSEKTMELYQQQQVNPLGGCLPLLIQMPVIFGLFTVLRNPEIYVFATMSIQSMINTQFFWISDLLLPDPWILPLLAGATTYLSSRSASPSTSDTKLNSGMLPIMMSLMIIWWGSSFPAGLTLYWVTSNLFQVFQQQVLTSKSQHTPVSIS